MTTIQLTFFCCDSGLSMFPGNQTWNQRPPDLNIGDAARTLKSGSIIKCVFYIRYAMLTDFLKSSTNKIAIANVSFG